MRAAMVEGQLRTNEVTEPRLVAALGAVPREEFVPPAKRALAYVDIALDLGDGRVMNPPLVTARLIAEANIRAGEAVLLIGETTDYAAALLDRLGAQVSVSQDGAGDANGFDVVIIEGAVERVPETAVSALREGGRLLTGWIDRGVTRLSRAVKAGNSLALIPFADMDAVPIARFAAPREFAF